jgi:ADP-ribose pyrophosphatase YjhB (NUDIX family)
VQVASQHGTSWSLPKGKLDPGEDALAAAKREIFEETGVSKLQLVKELGTYQRYRIGKDGGEDKREFKTITMFLFRTVQTELTPQDGDNPEARWVKPQEVSGLLTHPQDVKFYQGILHELPPI